jgi:hypothetical protein
MKIKVWIKNHKILFAIIVFLIIFIIFRYFIMYGHYDLKIYREANSDDCRKALEIAENYNYSTELNIDPFDGNWANFIDKDILNHYKKEFEDLKDSWARHNVELTYIAEVLNLTDLELNYNSFSGTNGYNLRIYSNREKIETIKGEGRPQVITLINKDNETSYDANKDFNITFQNVYLVDLELIYSDYYDMFAGYFLEINQLIIVDMDFRPVFIFIDSEKGES